MFLTIYEVRGMDKLCNLLFHYFFCRNEDYVKSVDMNRPLDRGNSSTCACSLNDKCGPSSGVDAQPQQVTSYQYRRTHNNKGDVAKLLQSSSPSQSKDSVESLVDYYTKTARLHQDRNKSSLKTYSPPASFSIQRHSQSMDMEETKDDIMDEDDIDERDRYLNRALSELSIEAGSIVLTCVSSADLQSSSNLDPVIATNSMKTPKEDNNSNLIQDVPELNRSVSFKNDPLTGSSTMYRYYSQSLEAEETKDDLIDYYPDDGNRYLSRALSEISIEAGSVVLSLCSSDLRQISTLDQKTSDSPNNPMSDVILFAKCGKEDDSGLDTSNHALDLLMANRSFLAKQKRDMGCLEREGSKMSIESFLNRGWSLRSWDGSVGSVDIRQELERGLSHMTM